MVMIIPHRRGTCEEPATRTHVVTFIRLTDTRISRCWINTQVPGRGPNLKLFLLSYIRRRRKYSAMMHYEC